MSDVIDLAERRAPVTYTVTITHHWDGRLEVFVADVASDERSRASVGSALARAAASFGAWPLEEADKLNRAALRRIDALMGAEANTPEGRELSELADVVHAYETKRYPGPQ